MFKNIIDGLYYKLYPNSYIKKKSWIELEISNICNAMCIFCSWPEIKKTNKKFQILDEDNFDKILKRISQQNYKMISFTPTTGEILTNKNWNEYIKKSFELKNIEKIIFYSNGILLGSENTEKLIKLLKNKNNKLKELHFSIGGIDREIYKHMYGVDKFDILQENINYLFKRLYDENLNIHVEIELRVPSNIKLKKEEVIKTYNKIGYQYLIIRFLEKYALIDCIEKRSELDYLNNEKIKKDAPCFKLHKTRYAADGGIWADGCVMSELPNNKELYLGTLEDDIYLIEKRRKKIFQDWKNGKIPEVCKKCSIYSKFY